MPAMPALPACLPACHACLLASFVLNIFFFLLSVGTSTDSDFEQLRRRGETYPLHIWQLAHDAHDNVSKMSKTTLLQMLDLQEGNNSIVSALNTVCHI